MNNETLVTEYTLLLTVDSTNTSHSGHYKESEILFQLLIYLFVYLFVNGTMSIV